MCNGKHFFKLDITNYDNGIELSSTDIAKLKKNVKLDSKKNPHYQITQLFNKMQLFYTFKFKIFPLSVDNFFFPSINF